MRKQISIGALIVALVQIPVAFAQRDTISIVGSSTVYPFSTVAAERFGKKGKFKTPKVESTGTGGGIKLFCAGVGVQHPDIVNASRAIKPTEIADCMKNGVTEIVEVKIGYDGIVIANSSSVPALKMSRKDVYLALAKDVPDPSGGEKVVPNPYRTWKDVNANLPATPIEVLGPPPTSGTRDAFAELVLEAGCSTYPWIKAIKAQDETRFKAMCMAIREDGAYIDAGENDNLIVQKLGTNPRAVGVFGYSFLEQNEDRVHGSIIEGVEPSFEAIAAGSYPISRPLFFYVKKQHIGVVPGIKEYLEEFVSENAMGEEGYLSDRGLIPLPGNEYKTAAAAARALQPLKM